MFNSDADPDPNLNKFFSVTFSRKYLMIYVQLHWIMKQKLVDFYNTTFIYTKNVEILLFVMAGIRSWMPGSDRKAPDPQHLMGPYHEIFHLWVFHQTTPSGPLIHWFKHFLHMSSYSQRYSTMK
jgi:hypothetical protein